MNDCSGYGKVILFGEHFVVYNIPAIASAIGLKTTGRAEKHTGVDMSIGPEHDTAMVAGKAMDSIATTLSNVGVVVEDRRIAIKGYKLGKLEHSSQALGLMLAKMNIDASSPLKVTLEGDLICASGVGASAAWCVAIARALSEHFGMNLSHEQINDIAYEGEKAYAGNPSGIDNTASTFGGLIWFQKTEKGKDNVMDKMNLAQPVEIIMANTGVVANTKAMVEGVKKRYEENPEKYKKIFDEYTALVQKAKAAVEASDIQEIGRLMNDNHRLLKDIEVSHEKLDYLVEKARGLGATGAKMTGGGGGGYMVALTPGKELQEKVASAMEEEGFTVLRTVIGV
jgi:mevalonate kinase